MSVLAGHKGHLQPAVCARCQQPHQHQQVWCLHSWPSWLYSPLGACQQLPGALSCTVARPPAAAANSLSNSSITMAAHRTRRNCSRQRREARSETLQRNRNLGTAVCVSYGTPGRFQCQG